MSDSVERAALITQNQAPLLAELRVDLREIGSTVKVPHNATPEAIDALAERAEREASLLRVTAKRLREVAASVQSDFDFQAIDAAFAAGRITPERARAILAEIGEWPPGAAR